LFAGCIDLRSFIFAELALLEVAASGRQRLRAVRQKALDMKGTQERGICKGCHRGYYAHFTVCAALTGVVETI
jgi:hypothetical protein